MSEILPEDNIQPGPVGFSQNIGLPFMPAASNQATAIYNALVRILDASVVKRAGGSAADLNIETLTSTIATIQSLIVSSARIQNCTITDITADSLTAVAASIETVVAQALESGSLSISGMANVNSLVVAQKISNLLVHSLSVDILSVVSFNATEITAARVSAGSVEANTLTSTTATIDQITTSRLVVRDIVGPNGFLNTVHGEHTFSTVGSMAPITINLTSVPAVMRGHIVCTVGLTNNGAAAGNAIFEYDVFNAFTVTTTPSGATSGSTYVVTPKFSTVIPTYYAQPQYTSLDPTPSLFRVGVAQEVLWPTDVSSTASVANFSSLCITAKNAGSAGNNISIQIVIPETDSSFSIVEDGTSIVVSLAKESNAVVPISMVNLAAAINNTSTLVVATYADGTSTTSTYISTGTGETYLTGGADSPTIRRSPCVMSINSTGTTLTIAPGLVNSAASAFVNNNLQVVESVTVKYYLELNK